MNKILMIAAVLFLAHPAFAAVELDADSNGATDIGKGGTNATTASGARTALSVPAISAITWATATAYTANSQSVTHGGHVFVCTVSHTSSAAGAVGNEPGVGDSWSTKWKYHGSDLYAAALGADDNYVTDAEKTRIGDLEATDSVSFAGVTATGAGGLVSGVANVQQGSLTLYSNADIYPLGFLPAPIPTAAVTLKFPPAMPTADNSLLNFDINGVGDWTNPATLGGGYTNLTSFIAQTPWKLFYSNTDGDVVELGFGNDGEYLKSNGAALAPSWATPSGAAHDAVTLDTELSAILSLSTQQLTLDSQTANYFLAAPNGSAGDPTFRAIVAADIPTLNQNTTGTAGGLSGTPNIAVGTISAGATGFSVDADGDVTAKSYLSSAADGDRYSTLPNNTTGNAPAAATVVNGFYTYVNELYGVENSGTASKVLFENDVDDTAGGTNGSTKPVTSNVVNDHISATDPHTGYVLESALGTGVGTMLASAPGAEGGPTTTIEAGTSALGTAEIASGACASAVTTAATNAATTDVINWGFNGDPTGVTGYAPTANGMLTIIAYPSSGNVNFKVCNNTAASITPGAITLNWRIQR